MLLICEKNDANYALLRCKTFSLKIWLCKICDKYDVWFSSQGDRGEQVAGQSVKGEYTLIDKVREKYHFLAIILFR